jgi:hypothetical protein
MARRFFAVVIKIFAPQLLSMRPMQEMKGVNIIHLSRNDMLRDLSSPVTTAHGIKRPAEALTAWVRQ